MKSIITLCAIATFLFSCESRPTLPNEPPETLPVMGDAAYIGLSPSGAGRLAAKRDLTSRIVEVDGISRPVTKDYRRNRVNLVVENGRVISSRRG